MVSDILPFGIFDLNGECMVLIVSLLNYSTDAMLFTGDRPIDF